MISEPIIEHIDATIAGLEKVGMTAAEMVQFFKLSIAERMSEKERTLNAAARRIKLSRRALIYWLNGDNRAL